MERNENYLKNEMANIIDKETLIKSLRCDDEVCFIPDLSKGKIYGIIYKDEKNTFICQNEVSGNNGIKYKTFKYAWAIKLKNRILPEEVEFIQKIGQNKQLYLF